MIACLNGKLEIIRLILRSCKDEAEQMQLVNQVNRNQMSPLHAACIVGNIEVCDLLVKSGAELIKSLDFKKFLPVHYAVVKDHEALICYFFEKLKLKLLEPDYYCNGHKLLTLAIQNGSYKIVKLLVNDYRVDPMEKDSQDFSYLHVAAMSGHVNIFLFFLSKQVPLHSKNIKGKTAL